MDEHSRPSEVKEYCRNDRRNHDNFWQPFIDFDIPLIRRMSCSGGPLPIGTVKSATTDESLRVYIELQANERFGGFDYPPELPVKSRDWVLLGPVLTGTISGNPWAASSTGYHAAIEVIFPEKRFGAIALLWNKEPYFEEDEESEDEGDWEWVFAQEETHKFPLTDVKSHFLTIAEDIEALQKMDEIELRVEDGNREGVPFWLGAECLLTLVCFAS